MRTRETREHLERIEDDSEVEAVEEKLAEIKKALREKRTKRNELVRRLRQPRESSGELADRILEEGPAAATAVEAPPERGQIESLDREIGGLEVAFARKEKDHERALQKAGRRMGEEAGPEYRARLERCVESFAAYLEAKENLEALENELKRRGRGHARWKRISLPRVRYNSNSGGMGAGMTTADPWTFVKEACEKFDLERPSR